MKDIFNVSAYIIFLLISGCSGKDISSVSNESTISKTSASTFSKNVDKKFNSSTISDKVINYIQTSLYNYRIPDENENADSYFSEYYTEGELPYYCTGFYNIDSISDFALVLIKDSKTQVLVSLHSNSEYYEFNVIDSCSLRYYKSKNKYVIDFLIETEKSDSVQLTDDIIIVWETDAISFTNMAESLSWLYVYQVKHKKYIKVLID